MKNNTHGELQTMALEAWAATVDLSARKIAAAILGAGLLLGLLEIVVIGHSLLGGFGRGIGVALVITLVAFVLAPLSALLGWLFRGSYNMRPLLCALLLTMFVAVVSEQVLLPLAFLPTVGILFKILIPVLNVVPGAIGSIAGFMTTFPHRFVRFGVGLAIFSGLGAGYKLYVSDIQPGREGFMAKVFAEDLPTLAKVLDSGRRPARAIGEDFRALERDFAAPQGR